nr:immunoglobulin light chain junction region [Macaca mulatta]MOW18549.1 immunoglobulin light chain junction region [Macaca mulatta]
DYHCHSTNIIGNLHIF